MWKQIAGGSVLLVVSTVLHVACIASSIALLKTMGADYSPDGMIAALASFAAILLGHTIQVWLWALVIQRIGALERLEDAIYFMLVTTTTLGYGDIHLAKQYRLFAALAAVSGLLCFGLSTAFFVAVFAKTIGV